MGTPNSILRNDDRATIGFKRPFNKASTNYQFDILPNTYYKVYLSHFVDEPDNSDPAYVNGDLAPQGPSPGSPVFLDMYIYGGPAIPVVILEEN